MRLTKHRQNILNLFEKSTGALSAQDVHQSLPTIDLVTIYRSLDTFVEAGLIKKLYFGEAEAQYEMQHEPHHHAICSKCNKVIHFTLDDEKLKKEFSLPGFIIKNLEITLHGQCAHRSPKRRVSK